MAYPVAAFVPDEAALDVIEATMAWYREQGKRAERIGNTLDRVGIDSYRRALRQVVGDAVLTHADVQKPKWRRVFYRGLVETFPVYGDLSS